MPIPKPFCPAVDASGILASPRAESRIIWHMANIPSICATVEIPAARFGEPKVKRCVPLMGSIPIQPSMNPRPADIMPFQIFPFDRLATSVMAQKHKEKYSQGPSVKAKSAMMGDTSVAIKTEKSVPRNDAVMPIASALLDSPFSVMG